MRTQGQRSCAAEMLPPPVGYWELDNYYAVCAYRRIVDMVVAVEVIVVQLD